MYQREEEQITDLNLPHPEEQLPQPALMYERVEDKYMNVKKMQDS